ncbi:MAG: GatB/YqeY domain-containing protein [Planctomycetota bacterium]
MIDELKQRVLAATKARNTFERDLLKVVLGDLQSAQALQAQPLDEKQAQQIVRKMVKSTEETAAGYESRGDTAGVEKAQAELAVLRSMLPQTLSPEQITAQLEPVADAIRAAPNDGAATGVAMKHLKGAGAAVDGKDVASTVRALRAG